MENLTWKCPEQKKAGGSIFMSMKGILILFAKYKF